MPVTITIRDETASGQLCHESPLQLSSETMTVRELIRERVYQEVQDFNRRQDDQVFRGLVQPTETEQVLNGARPEYRLKQPRQIDWKSQFEKAVEAYSRNGFFILIDDKQADDLDAKFQVSSKTQINFVKLTLLVGG